MVKWQLIATLCFSLLNVANAMENAPNNGQDFNQIPPLFIGPQFKSESSNPKKESYKSHLATVLDPNNAKIPFAGKIYSIFHPKYFNTSLYCGDLAYFMENEKHHLSFEMTSTLYHALHHVLNGESIFPLFSFDLDSEEQIKSSMIANNPDPFPVRRNNYVGMNTKTMLEVVKEIIEKIDKKIVKTSNMFLFSFEIFFKKNDHYYSIKYTKPKSLEEPPKFSVTWFTQEATISADIVHNFTEIFDFTKELIALSYSPFKYRGELTYELNGFIFPLNFMSCTQTECYWALLSMVVFFQNTFAKYARLVSFFEDNSKSTTMSIFNLLLMLPNFDIASFYQSVYAHPTDIHRKPVLEDSSQKKIKRSPEYFQLKTTSMETENIQAKETESKEKPESATNEKAQPTFKHPCEYPKEVFDYFFAKKYYLSIHCNHKNIRAIYEEIYQNLISKKVILNKSQ